MDRRRPTDTRRSPTDRSRDFDETIEINLSPPHSLSAAAEETAGPGGPFGGGRPAGPLRGAALQLHRLQQDALRRGRRRNDQRGRYQGQRQVEGGQPRLMKFILALMGKIQLPSNHCGESIYSE